MAKEVNQIQRRRHTNSKLGCLNCKRKKIRCDETLPSCKNCLKGKKDSCSYLDLSIEEIEKIKITHSLRNSQNKLLNSNYRLPTNKNLIITKKLKSLNGSSQSALSDPSDASFTGKSVLEFKFELSHLPIRIPSIIYPPLQYNNLSMQNFSNEFKVINDFDMDDYDDSSSQKNILPNGFEHKVSFYKFDKKSFKKKKRFALEFKRHVVIGESDLLDFISDILLFNNHPNILNESIHLLGETIINNHFKHSKSEYNINRDENISKQFNRCSSILNSRLNVKNDDPITNYTAYIIFFTVVMMKGSYEHYVNSFISIFRYFKLNYHKNNCMTEFLRICLQYNVMSIHVPSYNPQFLFEIESNLRSLEFLFNTSIPSKRFSSPTKLKFENLKLQYSILMQFLREKVLNIVFTKRDENLVTTYPPQLIYEVFKEWHTICPSFAMAFKPKIDTSNYDESVFINDLSTTLYTYYLAIAAALDAVFPACKYLYSSNFILPTIGCFEDKDNLTVSKYNPYTQQLINYEILQRHIMYSSRLYSFFKRRFIFYHNNINWRNYYHEVRSNKLLTRKITNVKEVPINSFNTTIIRPEHYPTKSNDKKTDFKFIEFNRLDDSILQNLYARNIETLNIFNVSNLLQYDYESMLLLKDYRAFDDEIKVTDKKLDLKTLNDYYEDKLFLLNN
ncbi:hypothetical protein KGF54_001222 [Candida jiufengensis]|uniref:uncharacterized protein n=1 Tax=Candida jiufengensis TaxID=497108 RepID=UPI0022240B6B|nr:uncharacterized protein KGF54_001222 [Candida jiufengensis]KAI5955720.1 hypothetical protein KGF54_001222 [Candida jiufengensis]